MRKAKSYKELEYLLNKEIHRGRLLDTKKVKRAIGKSILLFKIAKEKGCKIITKTRSLSVIFNKEFNTNIYYPISMLNELRGRRDVINVLLEEGLTLEEENTCRELFNVVGGYSSNFKGEKQDVYL